METLGAAFRSLVPTLNIFSNALLPFSVSAVAMLVVASRLSRLDEPLVTHSLGAQKRFARLSYAIKLVHALPLLIAPAVAAGLLIHFIQDNVGVSLSLLQNSWSLALIGFVQHVFIAYLLLEHVFQLSRRRTEASRFIANMPHDWRARRSAIWLHALAPPFTFVFGVMVLLQHAMLAAPTFLTTKNAIVDARAFLEREGPSMAVRLTAAAVIASAVAVTLSAMYVLGVAVGRVAMLLAARSFFGRRSGRVSSRSSAMRPKRPLWIVAASSTTQILVSAVVLITLCGRLYQDRAQLSLAEGIGFLKSTLFSPGVLAASAACMLVWFFGMWYRSHRPRLHHPERVMVLAAIVAFTPSSVFASMALPLLSARTQVPLLWILLATWSAAIACFMFHHVIADSRHPELVNLRLLKVPPRRFGAGVLLSPFGALAPTAIVVLYVLWIEDGLQETLRPSHDTVTGLLYRSIDGRWSPTSLLGILLGFLFWGTILVVVRTLTNQPATLARRILARSGTRARRLVFTALGGLAVSMAPCLASDETIAGMDGGHVLRYRARGHVVKEVLAPSATLRIDEMIVDNDSTVELTVPSTLRMITIEKLRFTSPKLPVIRFAGGVDQVLEQLSIRRLQYDARSRRDAVLQLSGLFIDNLEITGNTSCTVTEANEPRVSIEMSEGAAIRRASLTCLRASSVDLAIGTKPAAPVLPASIALIQVDLVSARIHGLTRPAEASLRPGGTIDLTATMASTPERGAPQLTLESLDWRGGQILLEQSDPEEELVVVNLSRVDRTGATPVHLRLSKFPRTELRWEYGQIDGDVEIEAETFDNLVLDHLRPGGGMNASRLKITASSYDGVALANVAVDQLDIVAAAHGTSLWTIKTVQGVSVQERISIPRDFLQSVLRQKLSPIQTRHFVTTLRDYGLYSEDQSLVGLDAVYRRKIMDLQGISPVAATVLDLFTGLGIRMRKPIVVWIVYTALYLLVSTALVWKYGRHSDGRWWRKLFASCCRVVVSLLANTSFADISSRNVRTALISCRNVYRFCFVLQLAVLSIYLSQTALS